MASNINAHAISALLAKAAESHPRISGQPTDDDIFKMTEVLYPILHNAKYDMIVVPGHINHNLVGLIQHTTSYAATWGAPFPRPLRPPPYDTHIPDDATPVVRNRMEAAHATVVSDFEVYNAAEEGTSAFIRAVVDDVWIKPLRDPVTIYNSVTAYTLIEYLRTNSGGLHNIDLALLPSEMLHYYANEDGIPEFILALEKAREKLARGGVPMSDATLLATAHSQVMASLHYPEATREWERLPPTSKTWTAWQLKYREANVERMRLLKANPTSFGAANNVSGSDMKAETAAIEAALNNIANAATSDSALMTQIMAQLKAITTRMDTLQHGQTQPAPKNPAKSSKFVPRVYTQAEALAIFDPTGYCSTHGWRVHASHTSLTCKKQGKNYNTAATRANTMGSSNMNKGWETNTNPM